MEDEKSSSQIVTITVVDTTSLGRISAEMNATGQVMIPLQYGRVKIRAGDDHLTGSFSSIKRTHVDALGQYKLWRECHFGELNLPEPGEQCHVVLEGLPYEMFITVSDPQLRVLGSRQAEDVEMGGAKTRSAPFYRIGHTDVIEKFVPHLCTRDCMPQCPAGVWIRE